MQLVVLTTYKNASLFPPACLGSFREPEIPSISTEHEEALRASGAAK